MIGVVAPYSSDTLLALVEFLKGPELPERLASLKAAEEAAATAQKDATAAQDRAAKALAEAHSELDALESLKKRLEELPAKEAAFTQRMKDAQAAFDLREKSLTAAEAKFQEGVDKAAGEAKASAEAMAQRERVLKEGGRSLAAKIAEHERNVAAHQVKVQRLQAAMG